MFPNLASLDRAYGVRGAALALGMACVGGGVHGVMAGSFDFLVVKLGVGLAGAIVLIMAGAISARQTLGGAILIGLGMGVLFFVFRWAFWAIVTGGLPRAGDLMTLAPWDWPAFLAAAGISGFWVVEAISMLVPAMIGCLVGQERPE